MLLPPWLLLLLLVASITTVLLHIHFLWAICRSRHSLTTLLHASFVRFAWRLPEITHIGTTNFLCHKLAVFLLPPFSFCGCDYYLVSEFCFRCSVFLFFDFARIQSLYPFPASSVLAWFIHSFHFLALGNWFDILWVFFFFNLVVALWRVGN